MNKFRQLGDVCETKEWARKIDDFCWAVIKLIKMEELTGEKEFIVQYGYIDLDDSKMLKHALAFMSEPDEACEQSRVLAMVEYGCLDVASEWCGTNYLSLLTDALNYANI